MKTAIEIVLSASLATLIVYCQAGVELSQQREDNHRKNLYIDELRVQIKRLESERQSLVWGIMRLRDRYEGR